MGEAPAFRRVQRACAIAVCEKVEHVLVSRMHSNTHIIHMIMVWHGWFGGLDARKNGFVVVLAWMLICSGAWRYPWFGDKCAGQHLRGPPCPEVHRKHQPVLSTTSSGRLGVLLRKSSATTPATFTSHQP